jgi:hypothetical protein
VSGELALIEQIIETAGVAGRLEALLPVGVRPRQLRVRTLLIGILLVASEHRPMFVRNVYRALIGLPWPDQRRLGVIADWNTGPHLLTYRQTERTFKLLRAALSKHDRDRKPSPDGAPCEVLQSVLDALIEASVSAAGEPDTGSYAADWTDLEAWARPSTKHRPSADPDAAWGHRNTNHPARNEMFFGYYLQTLTAVSDEHAPEVPALIRRVTITSPKHDPPAQIPPMIKRMQNDGIDISELLADSGYSYREPQTFALPVRRLAVKLIMDLHPNDRGPKGTHHGAIINNGNLYCPATPKPLLDLSPLPPGASDEQLAALDQQCAELARYKLSPLAGPDPDGYRRLACPAAADKLRCPLKPASLTFTHQHPTITDPPEHPPVCCTQKTITVPPSVAAKTAQKHDLPSPEHRRSYSRRTGSERANATIKDRASDDLTRGFCRLTDLAGTSLLTTAVITTRNLRIADAFTKRQAANQHRTANGLPPKQRRRRRHTLDDLTNTANAPPQPATLAA